MTVSLILAYTEINWSNALNCRVVIIGILFTLLVSGCASNIEKVGESHKSAAEKWKEMAAYAESELPKYGFTITAEIMLNDEGPNPKFELDNVKFDEIEQVSTIDLLRPKFDFKFKCSTSCIQLTEYIKTDLYTDLEAIQNVEEGSFLAKQLKHYEYQLFDFYATLFVLNDNINEMAKLDRKRLKEYLFYLTDNKVLKPNLKVFSEYAETVLSIDSFQAFLSDPKLQLTNRHNRLYKNYLSNSYAILSKLALEPSNDWKQSNIELTDGIEENQNLEYLNGIGVTTELNIANRFISPQHATEDEVLMASIKFVDPVIESISWQSSSANSKKQSYWERVKNSPVEVGEIVCTYFQNYFGVVTDIEKQIITVLLQGQAKQFVDGVLENVEQGSLFNAGAAVSFIPMSEEITFSRKELAPCTIL